MKCTFKLILGCMILSTAVFAQSNTVASGGEASGAGGSVSYTVGQVAYSYNTGSSGSCNEGEQQPYEFFTVSVNEWTKADVDIEAFPNPTAGGMKLKLSNFDVNHTEVELYDLSGKRIFRKSIFQVETFLPMSTLAPGTYLLKVIENQRQIQTIKVIKKPY